MTKNQKIEQEEVIEAVVVKTPEELIKEHGGVSKAIRFFAGQPEYLKDGKVDRGAIAKLLQKRYQHVRNVLTTEPKKAS